MVVWMLGRVTAKGGGYHFRAGLAQRWCHEIGARFAAAGATLLIARGHNHGSYLRESFIAEAVPRIFGTLQPEPRQVPAGWQWNMARPRDRTRPKTVGIAIGTPALRDAVFEVLTKTRRYKPVIFSASDVAAGSWPRQRHAAIVATPRAFRARQRENSPRSGSPVILVVREAGLSREKSALEAAHAFVLAERLDTLPSLVVLAAQGLSIMPPQKGRTPIPRKNRRIPRAPRANLR